jgi:hypothetical protein
VTSMSPFGVRAATTRSLRFVIDVDAPARFR